MMKPRRVVVTGIGVVVPGGIGKDPFWKTILEAKTTIRRLTRLDPTQFPTQIAAQADEFKPEKFIDTKKARRTDRCTQFALAAGHLAIEDSKLNLSQVDPDRIGVGMGTSLGSQGWLFDQHEAAKTRGFRRMNPMAIAGAIPNVLSSEISLEFGLNGPSETYSTGCSSGIVALGHGFDQIKENKLDIFLAGGAESALYYSVFSGFCASRILSTQNEEPVCSPRPFDKRRDGMVLGEGGGVLVLEELSHALQRGAPIYGEMRGWGATCDAYHMMSPDPEGKSLARALRLALNQADVEPNQVDYFNAHGTGTPLGDIMETRVIKQVFGPQAYRMGVSSIKPYFGYLNGASKIIDSIACLLALQHDLLPPTLHYEEEDPECDLDYVPNQPRKGRVRIAMTGVYGFGGKNAAVIFSKVQ